MSRVLVALGGNAMTSADGQARPQDQIDAVTTAMGHIADVIAGGAEVVLTHGNGPQVGNLLVKNELAATVVPPVGLDWCGAQTQGSIGFLILNALDASLASHGIAPRVAAMVTRTLVDSADPAFTRPTKPIGRYLPAADARVMIEHGEAWEDRGERGWRRIVASPEPLEILDADAVRALIAAGFVTVANGGGGIPVVRGPDGCVRGAAAVIDKDLGAALLASAVLADVLVIATDVEAAVLGYGTAGARPLGQVGVAELRKHAADGQFAGGSMGPKVEAVCRFVERGGRRGVITSLDRIPDAVAGRAGTVVVPGLTT